MIATPPAPGTAKTGERRLRLLPAADVSKGLQIWRELDEQWPTPHVTASWQWVHAWMGAFGDSVEPRVALWEQGDDVIGCGLVVRSLHRSVGRLPLRTIHLGTTGEIEPGGVWAEYVVPWTRRQHQTAAFLESLIAVAMRLDGHRLDIDGVGADLFDTVGLPPHRIERRDSPLFDFSELKIDGGFDTAVLGSLGKSTKKNVKRRLNKYSNLSTEWTDEYDEELLDELIVLHQFRWREAGEPGAFASSAFADFVRNFLQLASGQNRYALVRVKDDAGTVGCQLLLREEGRVLDFLSGFADSKERPSPGLVCHFTNIVEAMRTGCDAYEFLVGDARVKRDLSNAVRTICWAQVERPTRRMKAINAARRAVRLMKHLRKAGNREVAQ